MILKAQDRHRSLAEFLFQRISTASNGILKLNLVAYRHQVVIYLVNKDYPTSFLPLIFVIAVGYRRYPPVQSGLGFQ